MDFIHFTNSAGKPESVAVDLIARLRQVQDGSVLELRTGQAIQTQDTVAAVQADLDALRNASTQLIITDGITAPGATAGVAKIYVDTADGDLKCVFSDGFVRTIGADS